MIVIGLFLVRFYFFFFFKQKTAYEMRISDWSSDVCSSDLCCSRSTGVIPDPEKPGTSWPPITTRHFSRGASARAPLPSRTARPLDSSSRAGGSTSAKRRLSVTATPASYAARRKPWRSTTSIPCFEVDARTWRTCECCASSVTARAGGGPGYELRRAPHRRLRERSEEHTSELQSLMRISYAVFCLHKKKQQNV